MEMLDSPQTEAGQSIADELEQRRLTHRAARIRRTLNAMEHLAETHQGAVPAPLQLGMNDFDRELRRVEARLRELAAA